MMLSIYEIEVEEEVEVENQSFDFEDIMREIYILELMDCELDYEISLSDLY